LDQGKGTLPSWGTAAELVLRNAKVGALAGRLASFLTEDGRAQIKKNGAAKLMQDHILRLDLFGFRYGHLGGLAAQSAADTLAGAKATNLIAWLKAGLGAGGYNPDPFRALARALDEAGHNEKAREVRIAQAKHERACESWWSPRKWGLFVTEPLTGFSQRNHRAVLWFFAVIINSTLLGLYLTGSREIAFTQEALEHTFQWFWFALGNATPLVTLDEGHKNFLALAAGAKAGEPAPTWLASWFYCAKIAGFLILTFLAASMSGVGQKEK
jgi:hypothetical protein